MRAPGDLGWAPACQREAGRERNRGIVISAAAGERLGRCLCPPAWGPRLPPSTAESYHHYGLWWGLVSARGETTLDPYPLCSPASRPGRSHAPRSDQGPADARRSAVL